MFETTHKFCRHYHFLFIIPGVLTVLSRNLIDCLSVFRQAIIPRIETSSNCELLRATLTVLNFGVESLKAKLGLSLSEISATQVSVECNCVSTIEVVLLFVDKVLNI